ncbi:hypothetical protein MMC22_005649 [Lobaria immixta]|nr:hypothetical protein [Lobaria immixta]
MHSCGKDDGMQPPMPRGTSTIARARSHPKDSLWRTAHLEEQSRARALASYGGRISLGPGPAPDVEGAACPGMVPGAVQPGVPGVGMTRIPSDGPPLAGVRGGPRSAHPLISCSSCLDGSPGHR